MSRIAMLAVLVIGTCTMAAAQGGGFAPKRKPDAAARPARPRAAKHTPTPADARIHKLLKSRRVTFDFVETPLGDVLSLMATVLRVKIVVAPEVGKRPVTLRVDDMPAAAALPHLLELGGARMAITDGAVRVASAPPRRGKEAGPAPALEAIRMKRALALRRVSFDFDDTPLQEVLDTVVPLLNAAIVVMEAPEDATVTLRVDRMRGDLALQEIAQSLGAQVHFSGHFIVLSVVRPRGPEQDDFFGPTRKRRPAGGHL